jgi:hypothetical protein
MRKAVAGLKIQRTFRLLAISLEARLYFSSRTPGRNVPAYPSSKSSRCNRPTFSSCAFSSGANISGNGTVRSFCPFPSCTVTVRISKFKSLTRSFMHSNRRKPQPYSSFATKS